MINILEIRTIVTYHKKLSKKVLDARKHRPSTKWVVKSIDALEEV